MLTQIIGPKSDEDGIDLVLERINALDLTGTLYIGFPVVQVGGDIAAVDAFLVCREHGVVAVMVRRGAHAWSDVKIRDAEHEMRKGLREALERSRRLSVGGKLLADPRVITFDPDAPAHVPPQRSSAPGPSEPRTGERPVPTRYGARPPAPERRAAVQECTSGIAPRVVSPASLEMALATGEPVDAATVRFVVAAIQRLASMKGAIIRSRIGALAGARAGVLAKIDARISELDPWQMAAAVEIPSGPQRIRGLAGTGKTIVLAYKAALLHAQEDQARIALTFYNRSLYDYVRELIDRFHRDMTGKAPNWEKLLIRHCWGAKGKAGIYSEICAGTGIEPIGVEEAKKRFGNHRLFESVCENALRAITDEDPEPIYDVVLIDEAQDLPAVFMELVYRVTSRPKRVIWAYDDLQNLSDYLPASPAKLFGRLPNREPRVRALIHVDGEGRPDIILPICYRTPPWTLTTAHALGLGVYRVPPGGAGTGLVQFYDDQEVWSEIGYEVESGSFDPGAPVTLVRIQEHTPEYFVKELQPADAVQCDTFNSRDEEAEWVAEAIARNLRDDGLQPSDILLVSANQYVKRGDALPYLKALERQGIAAHVAGEGGSVDALFGDKGSVAVSGIRRAKGLEAAMVYVVSAEFGAHPYRPVGRRNALFSAITRSRAWVRLSGVGPLMAALKAETEAVVQNDYKLSFCVPTKAERERIRTLQRDALAVQRVKRGRKQRRLGGDGV